MNEKILVVDDEINLLNVIKDYLLIIKIYLSI